MAFTWGKGSLFLASTYWLNIWCNDGQTGIRRWRWFLVFLVMYLEFQRAKPIRMHKLLHIWSEYAHKFTFFHKRYLLSVRKKRD